MSWAARAAAIGAGALLLATATPAFADATGRIVGIEPGPNELQVVFTAEGLDQGDSLDPETVTAVFRGFDVPVSATPAGEAAVEVRRVSVLTLDTSGSMAGEKLTSAQNAALGYLSSLPDDVSVGLVTFADAAVLAVEPTLDRRTVRNAIGGLVADGSTALFDAVALSAATVGDQGSRSVVLLTDGADEGSKTTLQEAASAAKNSGAKFDAVSIEGDTEQVAQLQAIATPTGGSVVTANEASALNAAFDTSAQSIANELLVTIPVPPEVAGLNGNLTVTAAATPSGAAVAATAFTTLPEVGSEETASEFGPQPVEVNTSGTRAAWALPVAAGLLLLGLMVILGFAASSASRAEESGSVRRRLSLYSLTERGPEKKSETTALGGTSVARSAVDLADRVVTKRDFEEVLGGRLEAAGIPMKASEWTLLHTGIALGSGLLFLLLFGGDLIPALVGLAAGVLIPWAYLGYRKRKRHNAFMEQLPDTLQLMAGSMAAGYSLPQAVDAVVRESGDPIASEFNRALVETRLGADLEDSLDGIAARMTSQDFAWVVMAIRIQREVGGNLAELLTTVANTLRERERLRRQVRVLSAEGRLSAWILGGLPIAFAIYLLLVRRDYLFELFASPLGWAMIFLAVVLLLFGLWWLRRAIRVEV